jgi:hypothetical protein
MVASPDFRRSTLQCHPRPWRGGISAERPLGVAPHRDPTVNLHNRLPLMQDGPLVDIWPIDARGA